MYAIPQDIHTEVFAKLPDQFRRNTTAPWLEVQRRALKTHSFLEGPCFDERGRLYVVDIPFGRVFSISEQGAFDLVAEYDGEPNGMKIIAQDKALIADHKLGLVALTLSTGAIEVIYDRPVLERFIGLNDLFIACNGDVYFTDQGQSGLQEYSGRVYRLTPEGQLDCLLENIPSPNGLVLDAAEESLLVGVTRANQIWRLPLLLDGRVSKAGVFINMSGGVGPDGLALDAQGNLVVCHPGLGLVWVFSPYGELMKRIRSCTGRMTTNCAFHPTRNNEIYITESETGTILRAKVG